MTKQQIKILKYLHKGPQTIANICYHFDIPQNADNIKFRNAFGDEFYDYVDFIQNDKYFKSVLRINNAGVSYVENFNNRTFHQWAPYVFSTLALIVSIIALIKAW